ncbi:MAG: hypothetical protein KJ821_03300, partial [Actinobacteria bacterium]|nr:hypothetical protein [Actinomycetota bacterium]
ACEQYLNPEYRGKPIVVYNESANGRQMIIATSNEAKEKHGISRDTPIDRAKRISDVILVESRRDEYEKIADQLYRECLDCVVEEAHAVSKPHIDDIVMKLPNDLGAAIELTRKVEELYDEFGFDLAIGISFNEDYAHIATKLSKKYGLIYFGSGFARRFIYRMPVIEFPQIGPKRKEKLNKANIYTIGDITNSSLDLIIDTLGKKIGMKIYCSVLDIEPNKAQLELFESE